MDALSLKTRSLCQSLLPGVWKELSLEEITVNPITTGRSNRLFVCSRSSESKDGQKSSRHSNDKESVKVIVRFYGSDHTGEGNRYKCVTDEEELTILATLSSKGLSPRVLASFPGGRIDEYIESTILSPKQMCQPNNLMLVANKVAQYHAIQFKCEKQYDIVQIYLENSEKACEKLKDFDESMLADCSKESIDMFKRIEIFFSEKLGFRMVSKMLSIQHKKIFGHLDLIFPNFLFQIHQNSGGEADNLMIIDVENSQNQFRGIDLGKFFCEICLGDGPEKGHLICDSDIHIFVNSYLNKWMEIGTIDPEIDTHDHLFLEIQLGLLMASAFVIPWNILHPNFGSIELLKNSISRIDLYNHFCEKWSQIL